VRGLPAAPNPRTASTARGRVARLPASPGCCRSCATPPATAPRTAGRCSTACPARTGCDAASPSRRSRSPPPPAHPCCPRGPAGARGRSPRSGGASGAWTRAPARPATPASATGIRGRRATSAPPYGNSSRPADRQWPAPRPRRAVGRLGEEHLLETNTGQSLGAAEAARPKVDSGECQVDHPRALVGTMASALVDHSIRAAPSPTPTLATPAPGSEIQFRGYRGGDSDPGVAIVG
jgi:hypothetical protein